MKKKYYTPDIEEFHVGFEYKRVLADGHEDCLVYEADDYISIHDQLDDPGILILVKYLDREDIESFGFVSSEGSLILSKRDTSTSQVVILLGDNHSLSITRFEYESDEIDRVLFRGTIKNKSELRRVLKQVGVL